MTGFRTPVDVANRALQLLRRPAVYQFDDNTLEGRETSRCYAGLLLAELRRACWRFSTRRVILRSLNNTTMSLVAPAWAIGTAYKAGDIVTFNNLLWVAESDNTGNTPGVVPTTGVLFWDIYFGPLTIDVWEAPIQPGGSPNAGRTNPTAYFIGELVYKTPGNGTYTIYRSLINGNTYDPAAVDGWIDDTVYNTGQVVVVNGTNYQSLVNLNFNNPPATSPSQWTTTITSPTVSNSWRAVTGATLSPLNIEYPLGAGPATDTRTRNVYRLPNGFLRKAPTDPKADINPFLGAPTGNMMVDWLFESDFIVSRSAQPIMLRFVGDMQSVTEFDALFAEGLATRMAIELAPRLADAEHVATIIGDCREEYARTISEARAVNGIETGPIDAVEDDFVTCRL